MDDVAHVDASPLIILGQTGRLELLRLLARRVVAPSGVLREIGEHGADDVSVRAVGAAPWIEAAPAIQVPTEIASWDLGAGESQVLALTLGTSGAIAVLDDLAARRCARTLGISARGTLGTVLIAKLRGVVPAARPVVEELRRAGLFLSDGLVDRVLREIGE